MAPPKFDKETILTTRRSAQVYSSCGEIAKEFAVLGDISTAAKLFDLLLLQHANPEQREELDHLKFAFAFRGEWPTRMPLEERSTEHLARIGAACWPDDFPEAERLPYQDCINKLLEKYARSSDSWWDEPLGLPSSNKSRALAMALVIAVSLVPGEADAAEEDLQVQKLLGMIAARLHAGYQIEVLAAHRCLWPILARGALARKVNVDDAKLALLSTQAVETFKTRLEQGRQQHPYECKSMQELLQLLDRYSDTNRRKDPSSESFDHPWGLLRDAASEDDIESLGRRLNRALSHEYTVFLGLTNGMGPVWAGTSVWNPPLYGTQEVVWSDQLSKEPIELLDLSFGKEGYLERDGLEGASEWPTFRNVVKIGAEDVFSVLMIPPETMVEVVEAYEGMLADPNVQEAWKKEIRDSIESMFGTLEDFKEVDWCVLEDTDGETWCYSSFRAWLEAKVIQAADGAAGHNDADSEGSYCFAYGLRTEQSVPLESGPD